MSERGKTQKPNTAPAVMLAYHGKRSIKTAILKQLAGHRKADELIKGKYWENGKGCAVGCTMHIRFSPIEDRS